MHLRDRNFMIKCCYLNADKIYELPLSALQHTTGQRRRLTYPSALHARRMAAEAIADALLRTTLYSGTFKSHMATFPPHVTAKWQNLEGLLCYVQPTDGMLEAPGGNAFFRAAGPCVIIQSYPTSCTVCLVSTLLHHQETANLRQILDYRPKERPTWHSRQFKSLPAEFRMRIAAFTPQDLFCLSMSTPDTTMSA